MNKPQIDAAITRIVSLLANPRISKPVRRALTAQLFWGDRISTAIGQGEETADLMAKMQEALRTSKPAIDRFVESCRNHRCGGK
jgi:hypothetical protein